MYKLFENLVDPFQEYETGTPPGTLWAYYMEQLRPFRRWIPAMLLTGLMASLFEVWMIYYAARLIDIMAAAGPTEFWASHSTELLAVAAALLLLRPALFGIQSLFLEQVLVSNLQERVRWRAHRHMLGQSMGFFQNDFAGRLSNRVMQMGPAVEDSVYMMFEAIWYAVTFIIGALFVLSAIDWRIAVPLLMWVFAYGSYTYWIAIRVGVASENCPMPAQRLPVAWWTAMPISKP